MTTIGFFGDSFCAEYDNKHSKNNGYKSYIQLVVEHYNAQLTNLGRQGSSIYDTILLQLPKTLPDISVFVWTHPGRLFHRTQRNMNIGTVMNTQGPKELWTAARQYYEHLYDYEHEYYKYVSSLYYADTRILEPLSTTSSIVHLWSFGNWSVGKDVNNIEYPYTWTTGIEVRPALAAVSYRDEIIDHAANHLDGQDKNTTIYNWIVEAISKQGKL